MIIFKCIRQDDMHVVFVRFLLQYALKRIFVELLVPSSPAPGNKCSNYGHSARISQFELNPPPAVEKKRLLLKISAELFQDNRGSTNAKDIVHLCLLKQYKTVRFSLMAKIMIHLFLFFINGQDNDSFVFVFH